MKYVELKDFLKSKMKMTHIYQPLLIKSLIEVGGTATIRQLACILLVQDESQIQYYEGRVKRWPLSVLSDHGIITRQGELLKLNVDKLSFQQKAELKGICEEKMQRYLAKRGLAVWDYRLLDKEPIPGSMRFRVLKEAKGRCALCGATKDVRPLDIDHVIPRSRYGKTSHENLQVLCSECNRAKGNRDETNLKNILSVDYVEDCIFCNASKNCTILIDNDLCIALLDNYPVTEGHTLIVPRRHITDYFEMSEVERSAANDLMRIRQKQLLEADHSIEGFNIGINCGQCAGQTVEHCHIHLIPRRVGDTPDPRGGVRGVISDKRAYSTNSA